MFYNACVRGEEKENMQMHVFSDSSSGQAGQKQKPPVPRAPPVSGGTKDQIRLVVVACRRVMKSEAPTKLEGKVLAQLSRRGELMPPPQHQVPYTCFVPTNPRYALIHNPGPDYLFERLVPPTSGRRNSGSCFISAFGAPWL